MAEKICKNKFVALTYTITDENDNILERIDMPVHYIQGTQSQIIEQIETALEGHQVGDLVKVTLNPEQGFGAHDSSLTFTDKLENVPAEFHNVGAEVEFKNDKDESKIFRVTEIKNNELTVDGNHPLAGKIITYNVSVNQVRQATTDELIHGVNNMNALH